MRRIILIAFFAQRRRSAAPRSARRTRPAGGRRAATEPPAEPDIVVLGRSVRELRLEIELAEQTVLARFNDINSDDRFDIHCHAEPRYHSHIEETVCLSNSWREQNARRLVVRPATRARRDRPAPRGIPGGAGVHGTAARRRDAAARYRGPGAPGCSHRAREGPVRFGRARRKTTAVLAIEGARGREHRFAVRREARAPSQSRPRAMAACADGAHLHDRPSQRRRPRTGGRVPRHHGTPALRARHGMDSARALGRLHLGRARQTRHDLRAIRILRAPTRDD